MILEMAIGSSPDGPLPGITTGQIGVRQRAVVGRVIGAASLGMTDPGVILEKSDPRSGFHVLAPAKYEKTVIGQGTQEWNAGDGPIDALEYL